MDANSAVTPDSLWERACSRKRRVSQYIFRTDQL